MTGSACVRLLPDRCCHFGQELALQDPTRPGLDLVHLCLVFAETGHILGLATLYAIVDRKFCAIVLDIRISHLFTPFNERDRHRQALCLKNIDRQGFSD